MCEDVMTDVLMAMDLCWAVRRRLRLVCARLADLHAQLPVLGVPD